LDAVTRTVPAIDAVERTSSTIGNAVPPGRSRVPPIATDARERRRELETVTLWPAATSSSLCPRIGSG
jgi:hypothetical protein